MDLIRTISLPVWEITICLAIVITMAAFLSNKLGPDDRDR